MAIVHTSAYAEFVEFLTTSPTLEQMADFRLSDAMENHISALLEANRDGVISKDEQAELDEFLRLEHIVRMMKIRAYEKLEG